VKKDFVELYKELGPQGWYDETPQVTNKATRERINELSESIEEIEEQLEDLEFEIEGLYEQKEELELEKLKAEKELKEIVG
jgi:peptidoglycan hydrolase CwlO-like protein